MAVRGPYGDTVDSRLSRSECHPIRVLWAVPRSVSTAFERMVIERHDHTVFDEPFSVPYYFGPDRASERFTEERPDATWPSVLTSLLDASTTGPVFVKDMAAHAAPVLSAPLLGHFTNSFLFRDPRRVIVSLARKWPDVTFEELGFAALEQAYEVAAAVAGPERPPVLIDAHDLLADPAGVIRAWCEASGLDFRPEALTWEPGLQPQWQLWRDWYDGVAKTSGFEPAAHRPPPATDDPRLAALAERAMPIYERLRAKALGHRP